MAWTDARRARVAATAAALVALTLPSLVSAQSPITTEAGLVSGAHHTWGAGPYGTPASSVDASCPSIPRVRP